MAARSNKHPAITILNNHKRIVWPEILKYLKEPVYPKQFIVPKKYKSLESFHWRVASEYPKRQGKYLRPTLVMLAASTMEVNHNKSKLTAAAMQTSEDWILNHDDFEDNSPLRRGKPSLHKMYSPELAVNAGDVLHTVVWKMLIDNFRLVGNKTGSKVFTEFYKMMMRTMLGQTVDIKWFQDNKINFTESDWNFIADSKSAYYSIAGPLRLGAILGGATKTQLNNLTEFGLNLGRSFQLVDDVLDVSGDFGGRKQFANDIYEGKRTLLLGHLLKNADKSDREKVIEVISKDRSKINAREVYWVVGAMHDYGSIKYTKSKARGYKERAIEIFERKLKFLKKEPARSELLTLANFIVERDY